MTLHNFDPATFLRDHWQQRPLLIRQAFPGWVNPLEPDELAGLAGEAGVEARLITGGTGTWAVEHGPIAAKRFSRLGNKDWTLLVQAVDHQVPDVAALIAPFRFIPNWRIDDVMVSYAADGGGVGPHFDQYDVFLVQGSGNRRWRIGQRCDDATPLLPHADLRLLAEFQATEEWLLEPGDVLYLPPGVAHDGVAVGDDCMTYSIGFRAPSRHELIGLWVDEILSGLTEDDRYADPGLAAQPNPGEIIPDALARLQAMVIAAVADRTGFADWFGRHTTERKYPEVDWRPEAPASAQEVRRALAEGAALERNPASRFAFVEQGERQDGGAVLLFVDGQRHACTGLVADLARQLCASDLVEIAPALASSETAVALMTTLINEGSIAFAAEDDDRD
ncbi:JmjC domain-containing protein [Novosphingobium sp.]|uniref:JmjC domain-containing protein n=1 Tax=Novosphingobium sp. TaxID=1874826 RepID=UPI0038B8B492